MSHPSLSDSFENENQFHLGIIILENMTPLMHYQIYKHHELAQFFNDDVWVLSGHSQCMIEVFLQNRNLGILENGYKALAQWVFFKILNYGNKKKY